MARIEYANTVSDLPRAFEVPERGRCVAVRELDEAEHPAMARLRDAKVVAPPRARARAQTDRGHPRFDPGARRSALRAARRTAALPRGRTAPGARASRRRGGRPASQFPARHSRMLSNQSTPASSGSSRTFRASRRSSSEWPCALELTRPDELERENERRCAGQRPAAAAIARARSASSMRSRGMPRPARKCRNPKRASALTPKRGVPGT